MKRIHALLMASAVAGALALPAMAANAPLPLNDPARVAANNDYTAAVKKAKEDRKTAYAACANAGDRVKEKSCRKQASAAYKQSAADAKAAYRKAIGQLQTAKK